MRREGETPAQIFWQIGVKKSVTSCPNWGEGGGVHVIWTKSNACFGTPYYNCYLQCEQKSSSLPPQIGDGRVCFVWGHGLGSTDPALRTRFNDGASEVGSALVIRSGPYYLITCVWTPIGQSPYSPVLKIWFGPPNADFWSVWSFQKARKFRLIQPTTKVRILCFEWKRICFQTRDVLCSYNMNYEE